MRPLKPILTVLAALCLAAGCATKPPPTPAEIREQSGTLTNIALTGPWKAAPAPTSAIEDNWLATFRDPQLDALVVEAMTNNPDLRVAAVTVEQAAEYVNLARAAMRPTINLLGTDCIRVFHLPCPNVIAPFGCKRVNPVGFVRGIRAGHVRFKYPQVMQGFIDVVGLRRCHVAAYRIRTDEHHQPIVQLDFDFNFAGVITDTERRFIQLR
jgi:hypothetical protein